MLSAVVRLVPHHLEGVFVSAVVGVQLQRHAAIGFLELISAWLKLKAEEPEALSRTDSAAGITTVDYSLPVARQFAMEGMPRTACIPPAVMLYRFSGNPSERICIKQRFD